LEDDVPARNSVPSNSQYQRAVKTAVEDYSRRRSLTKLTVLSIVNGTASYDLPDDFLGVIELATLTSQDGVLVSGAGLIPVNATFEERYYITGLTITFDPTPTYTLDRDLWYKAGYALGADSAYTDMTEAVAGVVLLKAASLALGWQANAAAQEAWQYAIGDERVSKERLAAALEARALKMRDEYEEGVEAETGAVGMRAKYDSRGY
jgi:hypothetical protein